MTLVDASEVLEVVALSDVAIVEDDEGAFARLTVPHQARSILTQLHGAVKTFTSFGRENCALSPFRRPEDWKAVGSNARRPTLAGRVGVI